MNSKILIIDDEKDICYLISEILQDEKFITQSALNSKEAINKLESFRPDLIILDIWLGPSSEMDGLELLKKFKIINQMVPVIVISGHGTVDIAVNAIKNGVHEISMIAELAYEDTPDAHPILKLDQALSHLRTHERDGSVIQKGKKWYLNEN